MLKPRPRISYRIFLTIFAVFFLLFSISSFVTYSIIRNNLQERLNEHFLSVVNSIHQTVETAAQLSTRNYLRSIAERAYITALNQHAEYKINSLTGDEAKQQALHEFAGTKVGKSGYIYVLNSQGELVDHPEKSLVETNISSNDFVRQQLEDKNGFISYEWQNPGDPAPRKKVIYMVYFQPWDWIISVSAYAEDFDELIQFEDFEPIILSVKLGEHGYPIIFNQAGTILIQPEDIKANHPEGKDDLNRMINKQNGILFYQADDNSGSKKQKVAFFKTIEPFNWIVAATGYVDDFYGPLKQLQWIFAVFIGAGLLLSCLVSYYLSRKITGPFRALISNLQKEADRLEMPPISAHNKDEIQEISEYFSLYTDQINRANESLRHHLENQTQVILELNIFKEVFDNIVEGISITDTKGTILQVNPAFERITGYSAAEAIGKNPRILKSNRHTHDYYKEMWKSIGEKHFWSGEIWNTRKNGEIYPEWLTISSVRNKEGEVFGYAAVFNDITELVKQQERISFLAYHDHLTKLPNRTQILEQLRKLVAECRRKQQKLICMVCDLNNFKALNDSLGQEAGDELLRQFVTNLQEAIREEDFMGRIGDDDFAILIKTESPQIDMMRSVLDRIFAKFERPVRVNDQTIYMTVNIGIALYPDDDDNGESLLKRATLALNNMEKNSTNNSFCFFDSQMEQAVNHKINYLSKIREGLKQRQFLPYYQPKVSLITGQVVGIEALARWQTDEGLISPGHFIPVAEESGLIVEISWQMYEHAFRELLEMQQLLPDLKMSINVSPLQLEDSHFIKELLSLQQKSGISNDSLELEITESTLLKNTSRIQDLLKELDDAGFCLSIDDFGTGYSSLQYLKKLPFSVLKIDMSFVSGIGNDYDDEQIVRTIAMLAKQFGMQIVAEGIEKQLQADFLKTLGCDIGQGYLYAKPMPLAELLEWVRRHQS